MLNELTKPSFSNLNKSALTKAAPIVLVFIGGYFTLSNYLLYNFHLVLGLIVLVGSIRIDKNQRSWRYIVPILACFIILAIVKITFVYYLVWILCILALIELSYGKMNLAPFFAFLFISPLFEYFKSVFGFPIRIELTDSVVKVLQHFFSGITSAGNIIYFDDLPFYIDEACTGLNTLGFTIALTLVLLGFHERKAEKNLRFTNYIFFLTCSIALVIFSNAIRITLLILFRIPADTFMHEAYGIVVILTHIVLPLYFLTNQLPKFSKLFKPNTTSTIKETKLWSILLVIGCLGFGIRDFTYQPNYSDSSFNTPLNYTIDKTSFGVTKLQNDKALIYIKPPVKPYQLEHSPTVCWVGSGYKFTEIKELNIYNRTIYTGLLKNKTDVLYTAWWFDGGENKTINPFKWRLDGFKNNTQYRLINITCSSDEELKSELKKWL